jgi:hypothetical protein
MGACGVDLPGSGYGPAWAVVDLMMNFGLWHHGLI